MDTNLVFYKDFAFKSNYNRLVRLLWEKLLAEIEINLKKDDQVINERVIKKHYDRFYLLYDLN